MNLRLPVHNCRKKVHNIVKKKMSDPAKFLSRIVRYLTEDYAIMENKRYVCPICGSKEMTLRHEASYVYSYIIDSNAPGLYNSDKFQSYLYDKREQKDSRNYIECNRCGTQYPYEFLNGILDQGKENQGL
jgi:ssDNA-binding Zn-finger/Zn-ribbon topoisomerase 1